MYNNNRKYIYKEEEEERIDETGEGRLRGGCVRFPSSTPQGSFYLVDGNTQTKKRIKEFHQIIDAPLSRRAELFVFTSALRRPRIFTFPRINQHQHHDLLNTFLYCYAR